MSSDGHGSSRPWGLSSGNIACLALIVTIPAVVLFTIFIERQGAQGEAAVLRLRKADNTVSHVAAITDLTDSMTNMEERLERMEKALLSGMQGVQEQLSSESSRNGPSGAAKPAGEADECDGYKNEWADKFASDVTKRLNWRFYCLAKKAGTDKVTGAFTKADHQYQYMYSKYIGHLRNEPIKLLEIGLGCNMGYGPGKSLMLWRQLFPNAVISFVEADIECAEKYRESIEKEARGTLYAGDQADVELMKKVVAEAQAKGLYDIIIDDGGHNPTVQLQSMRGLWPALKSGGIFVEEDVHPTYFQPDSFNGFYKPKGPTFMSWIPRILELVHCHSGMREFFSKESNEKCDTATTLEKSVLSVECMVEACILVKQ